MHTRGFTLIELAVTLVVLATLLLLALPSFSESIERQRLQNATTELEALYRQARWEAVRARQDVTLHVKGSSEHWQASLMRDGSQSAVVYGSRFAGVLLCSAPASLTLMASRGIPASNARTRLWTLGNRTRGCANGITLTVNGAGLATLEGG